MRALKHSVWIAVLITAYACGPEDRSLTEFVPTPPKPGNYVVDAQGPEGALSGVVTMPDGPIAGAVVYLPEVTSGPPWPPWYATLKGVRWPPGPQERFLLWPEEIPMDVVRQGSEVGHTLEFLLLGTKRMGDQVLQEGQLPRDEGFNVIPRHGLHHIRCTNHDDEEVVILGLPGPLASQTNSEGAFRIPHIPVGQQRVLVWHPDLAPVGYETVADVVVTRGGRTNLVVKLGGVR